MLNSKAKREAIERLKIQVHSYEEKSELVRKQAVTLFELRRDTSADVVTACEQYLSALANAPRELEKSVGELRTEFESFRSTVTEMEKLANDVALKSGGGAAGGALAGIGVAALAPSAAMAIATTFGTASTGAAISGLTGAAATNAALAWLGGGAIAAGGGGMAAGQALLALAGPVGWAIGGIAIVGAGTYAWHKNGKIADEANEKAKEVQKQILILNRAHRKISQLITVTRMHERGVREQLKRLQAEAPFDYRMFTDDNKQLLGALINNVKALAKLLNRKVTFDEPAGGAATS